MVISCLCFMGFNGELMVTFQGIYEDLIFGSDIHTCTYIYIHYIYISKYLYKWVALKMGDRNFRKPPSVCHNVYTTDVLNIMTRL